jgi:kynurenine formamidase
MMLDQFVFVDLTHSLSSTVPSWDGGCGFSHENTLDYSDCSTEVQFRVQRITMDAGIGTHIDAPAHCIPGGATITDLSISQLMGPCVVLDVSKKSHPEYLLSCEDLLQFEKTHGQLQSGDILLIHTGWEKYWNEPEKYRNQLQFPSVSKECAQLLKDRKILGIGIDTLGVDCLKSGYPAHRIFLGAGIFLLENVASILQMPVRGGYLLCLPMKGVGLTEAPARVVGIVPRKGTNS